MKIVVFGDIHGNKYPLEYLFKNEKADMFVCLGDIVGYGPFNNECIDIILENKVQSIRGNHEDMFIQGHPDKSCSQLAKDFFAISYSFFSEPYKKELKKFPITLKWEDALFLHTILDKHIYGDTTLETSLTGKIFIGHSHVQFLRPLTNGFICNPGSLGQNRTPLKKGLSEYITYNTKDCKVEFKSFDNRLSSFIEDLTKHNYPPSLIEYYRK